MKTVLQKRPDEMTKEEYLFTRGYTDEIDKEIAIKAYNTWIKSTNAKSK